MVFLSSLSYSFLESQTSCQRRFPMKQMNQFILLLGICLSQLLTYQASAQTPPLILTGAPGDRLGLSMENAGDVNGDGIEDLIIGADHYFGDRRGEAQIYFGGSSPDFIPDVILTADSSRSFGWSATGAGDVNGDGYDDVLVSTLGVAVYLYFGGNPMDTTPDVVLPAVPSVTMFGLKVAAAGDVNGDGYDDFVVCAPPPAERGIFLYFGSTSPATTPGLTFEGFSRAQSAGDMNKDGYDDIIIGHPALPPDPSWAALHFGGAAMDTIPDLIYRTGLGDSFGSSLAGNGDLNGDTWPDLLISAAGDSSGGTAAGRLYVFLGGPVLDTIPDFTYTGSGDYNLVGYKEATMLGDINSDGYDDFSVSSDVYIDPFAGKMGKVHFFRGGPVISEDTTFVGEDDRGNFGWSVAPIDFDGDNNIEVFIGAFYAPYQLKSGKVYLYDPTSTSVEERSNYVPDLFLLAPNYPNPFNPSTTIRFDLPNRSYVTLKVFDLLGREVATLIDATLEAGVKSVEFAPHNLSSGVYFYQVRAGSFAATRKMILMR